MKGQGADLWGLAADGIAPGQLDRSQMTDTVGIMYIPNMHMPVGSYRRQESGVCRGEGNGSYPGERLLRVVAGNGKPGTFFVIAGVPQLHNSLLGRGGQEVAVGTVGDPPNGITGPALFPSVNACGRIPDRYRTVEAAGCEFRAIRAEGQAPDHVTTSWPTAQGAAGDRLPDNDLALGVGGGELPTVRGGKRDGKHRRTVFPQGLGAGTGQVLPKVPLEATRILSG
jgi:hypothetical protein